MYDRRIEVSFLAGENFFFTTGSRSNVGSPNLLPNIQSWEKIAGCEPDTHPEKSQNTAVTVHNTRFNTNSSVFYSATVLGFLHDSCNEQLNWFIL